ncbi:MAG TPA: hypothetical protein DD435_11635, partial [Cyanobacteria bacterium UBA8530]|nr:hypothetical protein [Cyanobacteria bacterium UBA8530]
MSWFNNLKIGAKITAGFIVLLALLTTLGIVASFNLRALHKSDTELYERNLVPIGEIAHVAISFQRIRVNLRDATIDLQMSDKIERKDRIKELDAIIYGELKKFEKTIKDNEVRQEFEALNASMTSFSSQKEKILALALVNKNLEAVKYMRGDALVAAQAIDKSIGKLIDRKTKLAKQRADNNTVAAN